MYAIYGAVAFTFSLIVCLRVINVPVYYCFMMIFVCELWIVQMFVLDRIDACDKSMVFSYDLCCCTRMLSLLKAFSEFPVN